MLEVSFESRLFLIGIHAFWRRPAPWVILGFIEHYRLYCVNHHKDVHETYKSLSGFKIAIFTQIKVVITGEFGIVGTLVKVATYTLLMIFLLMNLRFVKNKCRDAEAELSEAKVGETLRLIDVGQ
jgi:hypothetical protein